MKPADVASTTWPNWRAGRSRTTHFSRSPSRTLKRGLVTPHLFKLRRDSQGRFAERLGGVSDEPADKFNDNLTASVIIDLLEFRDIAMLLHELEELHDDFGGRAEHHLALALLLGVVDTLQSIAQDAGSDHLVREERESEEVAISSEDDLLDSEVVNEEGRRSRHLSTS